MRPKYSNMILGKRCIRILSLSLGKKISKQKQTNETHAVRQDTRNKKKRTQEERILSVQIF